jgi:hypothetical protein
MMDNFWSFRHTIPWFAWVAIVAIVGGCATSVAKVIATHRERMAKIDHGIDPDDSSLNRPPVRK